MRSTIVPTAKSAHVIEIRESNCSHGKKSGARDKNSLVSMVKITMAYSYFVPLLLSTLWLINAVDSQV